MSFDDARQLSSGVSLIFAWPSTSAASISTFASSQVTSPRFENIERKTSRSINAVSTLATTHLTTHVTTRVTTHVTTRHYSHPSLKLMHPSLKLMGARELPAGLKRLLHEGCCLGHVRILEMKFLSLSQQTA